MKQRRLWLLVSCCLLSLSFILFPWLRDQLSSPAPQPSVQGGYYDAPFTLTFHAPEGGVIYYTTDGSMPNTNASVYVDGIPIYDRSQEPNRYTSIQNVTPDWHGFTPDPTPVKKGTVIRAIYVNQHGISSEPVTLTYFVGIQPPERGYTLSLIFEEDALFGEDGIYVTGREYDAWYADADERTSAPIPNFQKDLEVPAIAQLLDSNKALLNQSIGLRLQGASTRNTAKKRFTLVAREEYSGSDYFDIPLYAGITSHSVMLKSNLPDAMISEIASDRSVAVQRSIPVQVYLNGEFWYDSYMLERYDQAYFRQHFQVDNRILVKNGVTDTDTATDMTLYRYDEFMDWVAHTDFSQQEHWEALCDQMDVQSYIDYISINYYLCNWDMSENKNYVLWASPSVGSGPYEDSLWRWCIFDIDILEYASFNTYTANPPQINIFTTNFSETRLPIRESVLFRALRQNPEFCQRFVLSFMDICNNNFAPERVSAVLEKHGHDLGWLNAYFLKRPAYAPRHLAEEFGLTGSLETVTVTTAQPEMGRVQVNTSVIDLSDGSWSGQYFTDYPITVTAIAGDGYQFLGWKGDANGTEETLTMSVDGGVTLEAVFAKVS